MQREMEAEDLKGMLIVSDSRIIDSLKFNEQGLLPAIVQDAKNGQVLMLAYMNRESLGRTLAEGKACYYSRSRQSLWLKGETSGNFQYVQRIYFDCDADTLLIMVEQDGVACHEGYYTCFHNEVNPDGSNSVVGKPGVIPGNDLGKVLNELYTLIMDRKTSRPEGAYTTYLFDKGQDKILKKVGEEAAETLIASKNHNRDELVYEVSDLFYHLMVLLAYHEMEPGEIATELIRRRKK